MTNIRRFFTIWTSPSLVLLLLLTTGSGWAQRARPTGSTPGPRTTAITFEAIPWRSPDTSAAVVNVQYRIQETFFVVLRNIESLRPDDYLARGDILVELRTSDGVTAGRSYRSVRLSKTRVPDPQDPALDIQGTATFVVPPGTYTVFFSVEDRQSERTFSSSTQTVTVPHSTTFDVSAPVFVSLPPQADRPTFTTINRGGDVLFGESGGHLIAVRSVPGPSRPSVRFTLQLKPDQSGMPPQEFRGDSVDVVLGFPTLVPDPGDTIRSAGGSVHYTVSADSAWFTIYVPLPLEQLMPGQATLRATVRLDSSEKTYDHPFRVLWPDRPSSLRSMDIAVDALRHIATEEEIASMDSFSESRSVRAFHDFWRKKDPDTTTAYNELMVEYYRRVDDAIRTYSLGNELNGYKTDRGRIYILYGSPTDTRRLFTPGRYPREIWTYSSLKRRFIFEDQRRTGEYRLIQVDNL